MVTVALATNYLVDAFPLPAATGAVLWVSTVMLVAGFLFYAALFTVAGTMVSTVEDAQSAAGPLYIAMWGTYGAVSVTVLPSPSGLVAQVLTYLPPTAPFVVPLEDRGHAATASWPTSTRSTPATGCSSRAGDPGRPRRPSRSGRRVRPLG
jgi:ABC-type Na+ efflux pump permease subunit